MLRLFWKRFLKDDLQLSISVLVVALFSIAVFYSTPLRSHFEHLLYDLRIRWKPIETQPSHVTLVTISETDLNQSSLSFAEGEATRLLNYYQEVAQALHPYGPESVSFLMLPPRIEVSQQNAARLHELLQPNRNSTLGIMGYDFPNPSIKKLPPGFESLSPYLVGMESFRKRRHQTIREYPFFGYRLKNRLPLLPWYLAQRFEQSPPQFHGNFDVQGKLTEAQVRQNRFWVNYRGPYYPQTIPARLLLRIGGVNPEWIRNKIVIVSEVNYQERLLHSDQSFANTPWQNEGQDPSLGVPLAHVLAQATSTLVDQRMLIGSERPDLSVILQTVAVCGLMLWLWSFSLWAALLYTLSVPFIVIYIHAWVMGSFLVFEPLSDTLWFFAILATIGAFARLHKEIRWRGIEAAQVEAKAEVAKLQGQFLFGFADYLQALVSKIRVNAKGQCPQRDQETKNIIQRIIDCCFDFEGFLTAIKQFSEITEQSAKLKMLHFDLKELLGRMQRHFEESIRAKNLSLDLTAIDARALIYGDEVLVESVIHNLLSNAIKYSPEGAVIRIGSDRNAKESVFWVEDQGPGIDKEFHRKIFNRFYRVEGQSSSFAKGNGLGLFLSRYFCKQMKGRIWVESELGKGARFYVALPRADKS